MSQEIIVEGSPQEIAQKIAGFPGQILRAILVVETLPATKGRESATSLVPQRDAAQREADDAWSRDFRTWAASHKPVKFAIDDGRDSIYADRLA